MSQEENDINVEHLDMRDDFTYYELFVGCPVCTVKGLETKRLKILHSLCGGKIFIGNDAKYYCNACNARDYIGKWKFLCENCQEENVTGIAGPHNEYNYDLSSFIPIVGQMVNATGVAWLQTFLGNIDED